MQEWTTTATDAFLGEIIKIGRRNFKVTRVTHTALAVERYYWFDAAYDWIVRKVQGKRTV